MNSYPNELLAQHAPLMFVAGLNPDTPSSAPSATPTAPASAPTISSPTPAHTASASVTGIPTNSPPSSDASGRTDPFAVLTSRLTSVLTARRKGVVWDPDRAKSFQVLLVDKASLPQPAMGGNCANCSNRPRMFAFRREKLPRAPPATALLTLHYHP